MLAVNSVADHMHLLIGLNPKQSISELMRLVKGDSSEFVNKQKLCITKFQWQEGYGAFSNSHSQIDSVIKYIANQKQHHQKRLFKEEYIEMLNAYQIDYQNSYIFNDLID